MVSREYKAITEKIKRSGTGYDNISDLLDMTTHIREECTDEPYCFGVTQYVKDNWLKWALKTKDARFESLYFRALLYEAPLKIDSFNRFMEAGDDRQFYTPRAYYMKPIIQGYQDLYDGKLDFLSVSQPKRTGKTSLALRLVAMFSGRHPEWGTLASGSGDALISVFYNSILELFLDDRFAEVFPDCVGEKNRVIFKTNADTMNIDIKEHHMFTTVQCRPIDGAVTGSTEARNLLYLDDTVKNHEEAVNRQRLDFLCEKVTGDILGRRIPGVTPILIQGTKYSLYDPISALQEKARMLGWKWREVAIPALDPLTDESNFECVIDGIRQFTTESYRQERKIVTSETWAAEFQQEPFEAKGRVFPEEKLNRYTELPVVENPLTHEMETETPDAILAALDTAESGTDSTCMVVGAVYGEDVYIIDVVWDNSPSDVVKPLCASTIIKNKVVDCRVESNSAGSYFGRDVSDLVKGKNYKCGFTMKPSTRNKLTRIVSISDSILEHFFFKDRSIIEANSQYMGFMRELVTLTRSGKNPHDDAPDATSMLNYFVREKTGTVTKTYSRSMLGL